MSRTYNCTDTTQLAWNHIETHRPVWIIVTQLMAERDSVHSLLSGHSLVKCCLVAYSAWHMG